jgi:hypothetical protein
MSSDFFSIPNFDQRWILARKSNGTLPGRVRDNLSSKEQKRLLEIIEEFEKSPTDLKAKEEKYPELMKLFYKGVGLDEKGKGTITTKENQRAAFELSALIGDAILQDQQNIRKTFKTEPELQKALKLQKNFRNDLEKTDFKDLLMAKGSSSTELSEGQKEYQTEKITSYLAENKESFKKTFEDLSQGTIVFDEKLSNLKTLAKGNTKDILNDILHTFKEFKDYSFTDGNLTRMKKTSGALLRDQANPEYISPNDNWERLTTPGDDGRSSNDDEGSSSSSRGGSRGDSETTNRILRRILARLEKLDPDNDGVNNSNGARGSRNNRCNCGNCANCNSCNNANNSSSNGNNDIPSWARNIGLGLNLAGQFLNITGLGNNNQNGCCYSPAPCYGGGSPSPCPPPYQPPSFCPPMPYYVGGNTWPWGGTNGINGQYGAFNNAIPSSVSSNPYSTASAYNPVNVNVRVNPVFNNNPYMASNSSALSSSNSYNLRRGFGIS